MRAYSPCLSVSTLFHFSESPPGSSHTATNGRISFFFRAEYQICVSNVLYVFIHQYLVLFSILASVNNAKKNIAVQMSLTFDCSKCSSLLRNNFYTFTFRYEIQSSTILGLHCYCNDKKGQFHHHFYNPGPHKQMTQ